MWPRQAILRVVIGGAVLGGLALGAPVGCLCTAGVDPNTGRCAPLDESLTTQRVIVLHVVGQGTLRVAPSLEADTGGPSCAADCTIPIGDLPQSYAHEGTITGAYCGWLVEAAPAAGWTLSKYEVQFISGGSPQTLDQPRIPTAWFDEGDVIVTATFVATSNPDAGPGIDGGMDGGIDAEDALEDGTGALDALPPDSDASVGDSSSIDGPAPEASPVDSAADVSSVADSGSDSGADASDSSRLDLVYCRCVGATGFAALCLEVPGCTSGMPAPAGTCDATCPSGTVASSCEPESALCL